MSRSERLLALLQLLRGHRYAITGTELASRLGISLRTLYRDIATLQAQGAHIEENRVSAMYCAPASCCRR